MKYIIFYSWQSDLPNNTNRGFIESVIKKAIKDIQKTKEYCLEPIVDRDTKGIPGAPNIPLTIMDKIKTCDAFVADVSIVTGSKKNNQRLSPNPNVLLELGYAIALLGWEKIILFCNEVYGDKEDLPFDIVQHRMIGYQLVQNDDKSKIRKSLTTHFKDRLAELLLGGKTNLINKKQPLLSFALSYQNIKQGDGYDSGAETKNIILKRVSDESNLINTVEQDMEVAKSIDGHSDPDWYEKLENYINQAKKFITEFNEKDKYNKFLINSNANNIHPMVLSVENDGNATANDVRIKISLPEWLIAFEKFPNREHVIKMPIVPKPKPKRPAISNSLAKMMAIGPMNQFLNPIAMERVLNRTSGCDVEKNVISFWAKRLLHKHKITDSIDRFYLMALPNAPQGDYIITGNMFCSEFDDWQEIELGINIV